MMNKLDLVPKASDVENVVREIRQINSIASIYKTVKSQIDLDLILNVKAFHAKKVKEHALTDHSDHSHPHDHSTHEHSTANSEGSNTHSHSNHSNVKTITLVSKAPIDLATFNQWLGETIWVEPDDDSDEEMSGEPTSEGHDLSTSSSPSGSEPESIVSKRVPQIFRMKGIVSVINDDRKYILQAVNDLFECEPLQDEKEGFWSKDEERVTRIVVIGRFLDSLTPYNASFSVLKRA
jgi:G3E family GTPase